MHPQFCFWSQELQGHSDPYLTLNLVSDRFIQQQDKTTNDPEPGLVS